MNHDVSHSYAVAGKAARPFLPGEFKRVALAFSAFFLILCSYYILRPVRDTMAVQYGAGRLQWLFSATFVFTLLLVPLFGWLVRTVPRARVLPIVYGFLMLNLTGFSIAFAQGINAAAGVFFVWLSVFNLFVVSLFWSNMGDCFSTSESQRLYGYIAAGGSCGALLGPALTAVLAHRLDTTFLLLLSAALLGLSTACVLAIRRLQHAKSDAATPASGGSVIAALKLTWQQPALRKITLLVVCYTAVSTVIYIELVRQVGVRFSHAGERTSFFATIDLTVNIVALLLQVLGTRSIVRRFGLGKALPLTPALVILLVAVLTTVTAWRSALGLAIAQIVHRAGDYAFGKPGREMIFTTVDAESRYKAKSFIDTAVYRAGDAASGWVIATMRAAGLDTLLTLALPAALVWTAAAIKLGRQHDRHDTT